MDDEPVLDLPTLPAVPSPLRGGQLCRCPDGETVAAPATIGPAGTAACSVVAAPQTRASASVHFVLAVVIAVVVGVALGSFVLNISDTHVRGGGATVPGLW